MKRFISLFLVMFSSLVFADGNLVDLGNGSVKFSVTLPANQQYVELFVRQNGIQNVAQAITNSAVANTDGTYTYSLVKSGYSVNDKIEYRFYSYLPAGGAVFTPGPVEQSWLSYTYGAATVFKTQDGNFQLGAGKNAQNQPVFVDVYQQEAIGTVQPAQTGWYLVKALPQDLSINVKSGYVNAKFKGLFVKPCTSDVWVNIQNTWFAYNTNAFYENLVPSVSYLVDITVNQTTATGVQPTTAYDCGGDLLPVKTQIGVVNVRNNTKVNYAYVVEFSK
jgi:hypothetical protein